MPEANGHAPEWTMPHVEVGQIVAWCWNAGGEISPAIVLAVGAATLNLSIHVSNVKDHVYKGGVRHKDDPFLRRSPDYKGGVWHVLPRDEAVSEMLAAFKAKRTIRVDQAALAEQRG